MQYGDTRFGKTVNYLDVELSLENDNQTKYKLYKEDTGAYLYLKTDSFHPENVFRSVIFSQMIRIIQKEILVTLPVSRIGTVEKRSK